MPESRIDALLPPEMAAKAERIGVAKAAMPVVPLFTLAVLAGAFIALGAVFSTTVATMGPGDPWPFGVVRLLAGLAFSLGLILVIVGGAELFTGNNLIVMAWTARRIRLQQLLRNWGIVYVGNLVGALGTAALVVLAGHHKGLDGQVGVTALRIADAKVQLAWGEAFARAILCNGLVCLAVWLSFSARTTIGKIAAVVGPITAFVAAGFEHCVANMYFVPVAQGIAMSAPELAGTANVEPATIGWGPFLLDNLLPVTLGNLVGGCVLVAGAYALVYGRQRAAHGTATQAGEAAKDQVD